MIHTHNQDTGIVTEIERYSIHDGPGVRSVVFLKGCQLRCKWCCNPETFLPYVEMGYFKDLCINCGRCIEDCPYGAIKFDNEMSLTTDRNVCLQQCYMKVDKFPCTEHCYTGARKEIGKRMTVNEIIFEVEKDRKYYQRTGGGVTITGGEISLNPHFVIALIMKLHSKWINTAIETNGMGKSDLYEELFKYLSVVFLDIKLMNEEQHKKWTKASNMTILNNARLFSELSKRNNVRVIIRVPIIPGVNDTKEEINSLLNFLSVNAQNLKEIEFLPYHKLGRGKYKSIGLDYELDGIDLLDEGKISEFEYLAKSYKFIPVNF